MLLISPNCGNPCLKYQDDIYDTMAIFWGGNYHCANIFHGTRSTRVHIYLWREVACVTCHKLQIIVAVQSLGPIQLFVTPWMAACQASLSFIISWSLLRFMSIELVMPSNHLILCSLFTLVLNLPQIRVISSDWFITSGRQSIGPSASVLLINIQSWHFLGLTGLISLLSKGLSRVFSSDTIQKL